MADSNYNAIEAEHQHLLQVYAQFSFEPVSAEGVYITCRDGSRLLDLYGGHAVASLGYAQPDATQALTEQAGKLFFQSNAVALEDRASAANKLAAAAPGALNKVFLVNSGAEANENALRIALKKTGRPKILALEHGFHGRTAAAGAVTWGARDKWYGFPQTPFDVDFMPRDDAAKAAAMIDSDTAAIIIELVQGVAGAYDLDKEYVRQLAAACKQQGALLIIDEVQTGVGRSGKYFAAELYDLEPDLLTTAKALGAGFPCGALLLTDEVAACMGNGDLGTTFGGSPLACAMINTVLDVIERDGLLENVTRLSARIKNECIIGPVHKITGHGFLLGLHCKDGAAPVRKALLEQGILTGSSSDPNVMRLLPPLVLADEHVDELISALKNL
ncbi:MAG: aspartate aminotransferase family protein [Gammaproteobacteria bacterium]